jgi:hypothetical protein
LHKTSPFILEHIDDVQANHAIVFENDAIFLSNFPEEFDKRIRMLPSDWAIFYLPRLPLIPPPATTPQPHSLKA